MPNTPPITSQRRFYSPSGGTAEWSQAHALDFIAERAAGIEWHLAQLNDKLFKIIGKLGSD